MQDQTFASHTFLVDTWMSTVKPVYKLEMFFFYPKWTANTHVTPFTLTSKT